MKLEIKNKGAKGHKYTEPQFPERINNKHFYIFNTDSAYVYITHIYKYCEIGWHSG